MRSILSVLNLVALIVTITVNYISNTKLLNGETVASVSRRLPTLVTPAPYAFLIWSIIYLGLFMGIGTGRLRHSMPIGKYEIFSVNFVMKN